MGKAVKGGAAASTSAGADSALALESGDGEAQASAFPCQITVRNHSHIALSEPVSGAFVQPGGWTTTTLLDAEHAARSMANFAELLDRNYVPRERLSVEGLPEGVEGFGSDAEGGEGQSE